MKARALAALSLGLVACTAAPTPAAKPAVAEVGVVDRTGAPPANKAAAEARSLPLTLANVVKQVAPHAKRAIVYGRKQAVAELEAVGIEAEFAAPDVYPSGCLPDIKPSFDVVVADEVALPSDAGVAPRVCGLKDVLLVARAHKQLHEIDQHGRFFVDEKCVGECDVFRIESGLPNRWFVTGGLPLTIYGVGGLSFWPAPKPRTATGVLVGSALVGGTETRGTRRIEIRNVDFGRAATTDRDALSGWLTLETIATLPKRVNGIARVTGSVRFEGALGVGAVHGNWARPVDAPPIFNALDTAGTLSTMTSPHVEYLLDGTRLAEINAKDDAAWLRAAALVRTKDPAPSALLRAVYEELKQIDNRLGRAVSLERAIHALRHVEANPQHPTARFSALAEIDEETDHAFRTSAQRELVNALFGLPPNSPMQRP